MSFRAFLRGRWWPLSFFTAYANPEWVQRYFSHRLYEMDLRQQGVPASSLPLVWDVEQLEAMPILLLRRPPQPKTRRAGGSALSTTCSRAASAAG